MKYFTFQFLRFMQQHAFFDVYVKWLLWWLDGNIWMQQQILNIYSFIVLWTFWTTAIIRLLIFMQNVGKFNLFYHLDGQSPSHCRHTLKLRGWKLGKYWKFGTTQWKLGQNLENPLLNSQIIRNVERNNIAFHSILFPGRAKTNHLSSSISQTAGKLFMLRCALVRLRMHYWTGLSLPEVDFSGLEFHQKHR